MHRRRLLAAVGATGVAGCLRLAGGDGTDTPGATDDGAASSPDDASGGGTDQDAEGEAELPTGLSEDGVSALLVDNHVNALADTTFRGVWQERNVTLSAVPVYRESRVGEAAALVEWLDGSDIEMYSTREGNYWRQPTGTGGTYGRNRGTFDFQRVARSRDLRKLVQAGDWNPPSTAASGSGVAITADGYDDVAPLEEEFEIERLESFSAEGRVREDGVITSLQVELEFVSRDDDRLFAFEVRHEVSDVGGVSVTTPDWYETATEQAPEVDASITDDGQFVEMHHRGGNAILPGTNVVLYDRDPGRNWGSRENVDAFEPGTTLFLWMEGEELRWQRGRRPSVASPEPLDGRYGFWMHRSGAEYFGNVELG